MNKSDIVVTIPIYKEKLSISEVKSLRQCCKILSDYHISFFTYKELDVTEYLSILTDFTIKYSFVHFDKTFFEGIAGYNRLMKNIDFYKAYKDYKYLLIYQLDAYVFSDELLEWCKYGYDYVGAPWFTDHKPYPDGLPETCGNGGLSLRRIKWFIKCLSLKGPLETPYYIIGNFIKDLLNKHGGGHRFFNMLKSLVGINNNVQHALLHGCVQEDGFFSLTFHKHTFCPVKKPNWKTAAYFAFEMSPDYLFKQIGRLPFGCHAFEKYEYDSFWSNYIN